MCVNTHNRDHKYIISIESLRNNYFETIIEKNIEKSKFTIKEINDITDVYLNKIDSNYEKYTNNIIAILDKQKKLIIDKIENIRKMYIDDVNSWNGLKFDYEKSYLEYINQDITNSNVYNIANEPNDTLVFNDDMSIIDCSNFDKNLNMRQILSVISSTIDKQINQENYFNDYKQLIKVNISESVQSLKSNLKEIIDKLFFNEKIENTDKSPNNSFNNISLPIKRIRHEISPNTTFNIDSFSNPLVIEIFPNKKSQWYSFEFIEDMDYLVCGYQTGEILIFKESDNSLIRTYRPRFKRIRKILYSAANSSIFASYDDGYIIMISLIDLKFTQYRMSTSQIYTMEILPNHNVLVFGGVEKKILYSYILDLNKIIHFNDSEYGEVQTLYYDEKKDLLLAGLRKSVLIFYLFETGELIHKHNFKGKDSCVMNIKKFKDDIVICCGYLMNIYFFRLTDFQCVNSLQLDLMHIYDIYRLDDNYLFASTFDENSLLIVDLQKMKIMKTFEPFTGAMQISFFKNNFYITSHSHSLKKLNFN